MLSGLNRVAKKLNVDCAPAMIGWEFSGGGCHPVFDGFVVCEVTLLGLRFFFAGSPKCRKNAIP
jgi:hypothetical protein